MGEGSLNLGELYAKLALDYSDLHKAEMASLQFAKNTSSNIGKVSEKFKAVGSKLTTSVTLPIIGAGAASLKFSQDFDKSIREVNSLLDASDKDFTGLKDQIRGVSLALGIDLVQAGQAAYEAIGAGVPKDNLIDFLTVSGKAAIGGVTEIKTVVDGLTTVTNSWGKSAGTTKDISDQMFQAVKYGKVTFDQLASSIAIVGGLAPALGVSFKEVAAYSALATARGEKQTVAMTQMRQAMAELIKPNKDMAELIKAAGIKSVKATVEQKGLAGTYELLSKAAIKNKSSLEKSIGSVEALQFVLRTTGKNADSFKTSLDQIANSQGAAQAAFEELDKARGFDKMINNLKAVATIIGDQLMPIIVPLVEQFANFLSKANELDPGLTRIGIALGAIAAAVGPLLLAVGTIGAAIAPLIVSAGGLGAALAGIAAIAGPVTLAIAAIAGAGYLLYKNWQPLKTFFADFAKTNKPAIDSLKDSWSELASVFGQDGSTVSTFFENINNGISNMTANARESSSESKYFATSWNEFFLGIVSASDLALRGFKSFWESTKQLGYEMAQQVDSDWTNLTQLGYNIAKGLDESLSSISASSEKIINLFKILWEAVKNSISSIDWKKLGGDIMTGLRDGIISATNSAVEATKNASKVIIDAAKETFDSHSPSLKFVEIGKDLMLGLGIGIRSNTNAAVTDMLAASDYVLGAAREKLSKEEFSKSFGTFQADLLLNPNSGDSYNYELEVQKEQAHYQLSLEMLQKAQEEKIAAVTSYQQLREQIEQRHTDNLISIQKEVLSSTRSSLDQTLSSLEQFGQKQSGIYKAIFAVSKAFAIAEAILAMQQNIANASKVGFPYNIPFIAGAVAQGASIVANVQAISGAFNNGGYIPTGQIGMVGEKGAELVTGPANVLSTQNTRELFNSRGGSNTNVIVEVFNYGGSQVEVQQSGDDDNKKIQIIIDKTKQSIASDIRRGDGIVDRAFADTFKLQRTGS